MQNLILMMNFIHKKKLIEMSKGFDGILSSLTEKIRMQKQLINYQTL